MMDTLTVAYEGTYEVKAINKNNLNLRYCNIPKTPIKTFILNHQVIQPFIPKPNMIKRISQTSQLIKIN